MNATEQYFPVVLFIYYAVLTFESVDEILKCDHSNGTSLALLPHNVIHFFSLLRNETSKI